LYYSNEDLSILALFCPTKFGQDSGVNIEKLFKSGLGGFEIKTDTNSTGQEDVKRTRKDTVTLI